MGTPEDSALHGLRVSVGHILDNFGFTQISDDSLEVLSDIMKRFIKKLATNGKMYAEHAGRNSLSSDDLCCAFKKMKYSTPDLYQFIAQNNLNAPTKAMPRFPVPRSHSRPLYHPQPSDKELETRPDHIPGFYQAAHPEWTRDGADYLAVMKPSTSTDKKGAAPDFPSFLDFSSKDLGISKGDRRPAPPPLIRSDESSATGIRSSANISSMKLNNYEHPAPPPMFKRKTKPPFNGMKDSRSSTPIGRSHSPFGFFDRSESMRTESPSTSREDKPKLKPRPSLKSESKVDSPIPPVVDEGGSSPMPTLELNGGYTKDEAHDLPLTPRGSDSDTNEFGSDPYGTPRVDDSVVAANKILFERLKAEQERETQKRKEKDKENEEKQRKKEEAKRKKEEKKREQERQKKEKEERERLRRKEEEARLERERKAREIVEKERKECEDRLRKEKAELERRRAAETATPPMRMAESEPNSLKLVISNPMSSNASSAFSPPSVKPSTILESTSTSAAVNGEDDSDTVPFVEGVAAVNGATEFPLNISITATETPSPSKKKHKKKDKERDRSASPHKKHKKDKEHKKKKKEKRDREAEREKHKKKDKHRESKESSEQVLRVPALKIRLGDQTPSQNDTSSSTSNHELKLKFKNILPEKNDDKVPPLRFAMTPKEDMKPTPEKTKLFNKAELKTTPSKTLTEKEEKQRRREERKRREREETQKRQKEELERFQREHEEKQRKEAEEKRRKEEEQKKIEEAEERRRKEREEKEREQREREERERREKEKEAARKEKEKERERERQKKESLSTPIVAHVSADSVLKKKHKKEKREREEREREEREREKERQKAREKEKEEKKKVEEIAADEPEIWICPACSVAWSEGVNMVACDTCNNWFHWTCVNIDPEHPPDEATSWFCKKCIKKNAKRQSMPTGGGPPKKKKKSEGHEYFK